MAGSDLPPTHSAIKNPGAPDVPPPPPSDAAPEVKDAYWRAHVYQGDKMPQLTWRAVLMGGMLGMVMSAANLYTTLSIGWAFGIAITASVLSFVIWNFVRFCSGNRLSQMSVLENACMASTASAAGYATGSTIATMFGALVLLHDPLPGQTFADINTWDVTKPWVVVVFTLCTGLMGVFLAIPMKRQMINHEQLPFPSGTAAAETLRSLYSESADALRKAYVLVLGLALGLLIGFLRAGDDVLEKVGWLKWIMSKVSALRIPADIEMHFISKLYPGGRFPAGFAFEPSALLIAAGMIVGMRISVSLVLSSLLLYGVVGPELAKVDAAHMEKGAVLVFTAVEKLPEQADPVAAAAAAEAAVTGVAAQLDIDAAPLAAAAKDAAHQAMRADAEARARRATGELADRVTTTVTTAAPKADVAAVKAALSTARDATIKAAAQDVESDTGVLVADVTRAAALAAADAAEAEISKVGGGSAGVRETILESAGSAANAVAMTEEERTALAGAVVETIRNATAKTAATNYANRDAIRASADARSAAIASGKTPEDADTAAVEVFDQKKYKPNFIWNWGGEVIVITRWSLWGGTAVMVFSSLMSVALQWKTIARAFGGVKGGAVSGEDSSIEVPGRWMVIGMLPITIAMVWVQVVAFGASWYAGVIAVAMSFVLSLVASRATGETDTTPIGAMGKVMQLMFAVLVPKNIAANLASAGIAANSASSSADLLTDLKMGYLLGANPRRQFLAQFIGVFFGTVAIVPIWYAMVPTREKLEQFALPSTRAWEAVARVLVKGVGELPQSAVYAIVIGAIVGMALPVIERLLPPKARKYMPSATGIGLAWVMPFQNAFSFFVGALIAMVWGLTHKKSEENYKVPIASGLIAGESLMAAALAIAATVAGLLNS